MLLLWTWSWDSFSLQTQQWRINIMFNNEENLTADESMTWRTTVTQNTIQTPRLFLERCDEYKTELTLLLREHHIMLVVEPLDLSFSLKFLRATLSGMHNGILVGFYVAIRQRVQRTQLERGDLVIAHWPAVGCLWTLLKTCFSTRSEVKSSWQ